MQIQRRFGCMVAVLLTLPAGLTTVASAQCEPPFQQKLLASDGGFEQYFGSSVALEGTRLLVGARGDNDVGFAAGAGYVLEHHGSQWIESAKLTAPNGTPFDYLGTTCALSGNWALLGSYADIAATGSVSAFKLTGGTWVLSQKIFNPDAEQNSDFSLSMAASNGRLIVGAPNSDLDAPGAGSVYLFHDTPTHGWAFDQRLSAPDAGMAGQPAGFGWSVSLWGTRAVVGAPYADTLGIDSGTAWVYEWNGSAWIQVATLLAGDATQGDSFGRSVGIWQDKIVVGAPAANFFFSGAAYVFEPVQGLWRQTAKLEPPQDVGQLQFGTQVAIHGNHALVGALDSEVGEQAGAAWLFVDDGPSWSRLAKIIGPDSEAHDLFGVELALGPSRAVICAPTHKSIPGPSGIDAGAAYVYTYCPFEDLGGAHPGTIGAPVLSGTGSLAAGSGNTFALSGAAPFAPALVLVAAGTAGAVPFKGGTLKAIPVALAVAAATNASGGLSLPFMTPALPAGTAFVVQVAIADAGASAGVALSNALLATMP